MKEQIGRGKSIDRNHRNNTDKQKEKQPTQEGYRNRQKEEKV